MTSRAPAPHSSPRRRRAGWAVVAALAAAVVGVNAGAQRPAGDAQPLPAPADAATPSPPRTTAAPPTPRHERTDALAAARTALAAWARFAATGDLAQVERHVAADGPQYAQLQREARTSTAAPSGASAPRFSLRDATVSALDDRAATVAVTVVVSRPGQPDTDYAWTLHLRRADRRAAWQLWAVEPRP